jgi:hypothetical protein
MNAVKNLGATVLTTELSCKKKVIPIHKTICSCIYQTNLRRPTDREAAACRRSYSEILRVEVVAWSAQRILTAVILGFLDRSR